MPKLHSISNGSLNADDSQIDFKLLLKKRQSLPNCFRKLDDKTEQIKKFKIDSDSNLVEVEGEERRDFQLHLEK